MNYTCRYCGHITTITEPNFANGWSRVSIAAGLNSYGLGLGLGFGVLACPNADCKGLSLKVMLTGRNQIGDEGKLLREWTLLPESSAKPQPAYIPAQIVEDYTQACRIKDLSAKASATLSRRCLQGMLRDFWNVHESRLVDEIKAIKGKTSASEWDAIDAVRSIGNIGAHMEQDVNVIIDVEPEEADELITLIEYLFRQWYVRRHEDEENLAKIKAMAAAKKQAKTSAPNPAPPVK